MYYSVLQTKVTVLVSKSIITEDHNNDQYPVTDIRTITTQGDAEKLSGVDSGATTGPI